MENNMIENNTKLLPFQWKPLPEDERKKLKKLPVLRTDKEAEDFVDTADLSEYDLSDFKRVSFEELMAIERRRHEYRKKTKVLHLRLPEMLLDALRAKARQMDMPCSSFVRMVLEERMNGELSVQG